MNWDKSEEGREQSSTRETNRRASFIQSGHQNHGDVVFKVTRMSISKLVKSWCFQMMDYITWIQHMWKFLISISNS